LATNSQDLFLSSLTPKQGSVIVARIMARAIEDPNGCLVWQGAKTQGYGAIGFSGKTFRVHRVLWILKRGLPRKPYLLHRCDNPSCISLEHIFEGTHEENMADMMAKGRSSRGKPRPSEQGENHYVRRRGISMSGESHPAHKLTLQQVEQIRREYSPWGRNGKSGAQLAREFGVHVTTVQKVGNGKLWK